MMISPLCPAGQNTIVINSITTSKGFPCRSNDPHEDGLIVLTASTPLVP